MPFLKVGNEVFNTDHVTRMRITDESVVVYLSTPWDIDEEGTPINRNTLEFTGNEAETLKQWIQDQKNVRDLTQSSSEGPGVYF